MRRSPAALQDVGAASAMLTTVKRMAGNLQRLSKAAADSNERPPVDLVAASARARAGQASYVFALCMNLEKLIYSRESM